VAVAAILRFTSQAALQVCPVLDSSDFNIAGDTYIIRDIIPHPKQ
jgi:hypothetical protein